MAETVDLFATSDNLYSIVVAGNMNPAIHHPRWYVETQLLSEDEANQAMAKFPGIETMNEVPAGALICSNVMSQFTFSDLRITCLENNWTILATSKDSYERSKRIAVGVFKVLHHTPVGAYGFNFSFHRSTKSKDIARHLAKLAETLPLGLKPVNSDSEPALASFRYHVRNRDCETVVVVEPSTRSNEKLFLGINFTHRVQATGLFDLAPMLEAGFSQDTHDAEVWLNRTSQQLDMSLGE
jgi:hypothetical protein